MENVFKLQEADFNWINHKDIFSVEPIIQRSSNVFFTIVHIQQRLDS